MSGASGGKSTIIFQEKHFSVRDYGSRVLFEPPCSPMPSLLSYKPHSTKQLQTECRIAVIPIFRAWQPDNWRSFYKFSYLSSSIFHLGIVGRCQHITSHRLPCQGQSKPPAAQSSIYLHFLCPTKCITSPKLPEHEPKEQRVDNSMLSGSLTLFGLLRANMLCYSKVQWSSVCSGVKRISQQCTGREVFEDVFLSASIVRPKWI